jgi:hypothetical protein
LAVEDRIDECIQCCEQPCMWLAKKEDMQLFDISECGHVLDLKRPPKNICRKKVYWQMFLHINQEPSGAGIRIEQPECIEEDGTQAMLPFLCFMRSKRSAVQKS